MITKAALLLFRDNENEKELLFTREAGKPYFAFPGGKKDEGETVEEALYRELQEELGTTVRNAVKLGVVAGRTPDGREIEMHLYSGQLEDGFSPQAEIEEICWLSRPNIEARREVMTPMTLDHVLPFLQACGIW